MSSAVLAEVHQTKDVGLAVGMGVVVSVGVAVGVGVPSNGDERDRKFPDDWVDGFGQVMVSIVLLQLVREAFGGLLHFHLEEPWAIIFRFSTASKLMLKRFSHFFTHPPKFIK